MMNDVMKTNETTVACWKSDFLPPYLSVPAAKHVPHSKLRL